MANNYTDLMQRSYSMNARLLGSSVSEEDATRRTQEYEKIFARHGEMFGGRDNILQKQFSGYAETPLLSTQYFNASVASFVSSFAGFMSVERDFEQPTGLFYWLDVLGVSDLRTIVPNLGPDQYQGIDVMGSFSTNLTVSTQSKSYSTIIGRKLIPGSLRVRVDKAAAGSVAASSYELIDNGQGEFMSIAGKLTTSKIWYLNGKVEFELANMLAANDTITITGKEDVVGTPCNTQGASNTHQNDKRFLAKMQQFGLTTVPDMLVAEYDIASLGAAKKATGTDMASFLFNKLRELYTKTINYRLVHTLEESYVGDLMELNLSNTEMKETFYDYKSRIDLFDNYLVDVGAAICTKAWKAVNTTAYVCGNRAANQFQKGRAIGKFVRNEKMSYINDLLGWYDNIPVLRSADIKEDTGKGTFYAIHKTTDGQMAPLARGIYMPLTDTPTVGNYQNPTQMAAGIYYQEGVKVMAPELVQKVTVTMGL